MPHTRMFCSIDLVVRGAQPHSGICLQEIVPVKAVIKEKGGKTKEVVVAASERYKKASLVDPQLAPETERLVYGAGANCLGTAVLESVQNITIRSQKSQNQGRKHININKSGGVSQDWVGGKHLLMCFCWVIPYGRDQTHKQNCPRNLGTDNPVNPCLCVLCSVVFFTPNRKQLCGSSCPTPPKRHLSLPLSLYIYICLSLSLSLSVFRQLFSERHQSRIPKRWLRCAFHVSKGQPPSLRVCSSPLLPCPPHPSPGSFLPQNYPLSATSEESFVV